VSNSRHMLFRTQISRPILSMILVAALFGTGYQTTAQVVNPSAPAVQTIPITVTPQVIQPLNGKLPTSMTIAVFERDCDATKGIDLTQGGATPYSLTITGSGLTLSSQNGSKCTITSTLAIDPNAPPGAYSVILDDPNKNPVGSADLAVMANTAAPIPPGIAPEVDVMWNVMSQSKCQDVFGKRIGQRDYCIEVKIGNNSGYPIQIAGVGFSSRIENLPGTPLVTIANSSYVSNRAVLIRENVTNGRNVLYNSLQAAGVLMAAFTPYFGTGARANGTFNNARTHWTIAASIVSGPLLSAFNIVAPNPIITQLSNLDDETFRDNQVIPNNAHMRTMVFVEKEVLTEQLRNLSIRYNTLARSSDDNTKTLVSDIQSDLKETINNSTVPKYKKGNQNPLLVKLALGSLVIVGQEIQYLQRIQLQSNAASSPLSAPVITTITPALALPNTAVVIAGANFGSSQGSSSVKFGSTLAGQASSWSPTSITATVPASAAAGSTSVVVSVGGTDSAAASFTVCPTVAGQPCQLTIAPLSPITHGTAQAVTVTVNDSNGVMTGFRGTVLFTSTDAAATLPGGGSYTFTANDPGVHTFDSAAHGGEVTFNTPGTQTLTVTTGGVSASASVTVQ